MGIFSSFTEDTYSKTNKTRHQNTAKRLQRQYQHEDVTANAAEGGFTHALMAALFALPVAAMLGFLILLVMSTVAFTDPDPDRLTLPLALGALSLTSLMGGFIAARRGRTNPLLCGALLGLLLLLLLVCGSMIMGNETAVSLSTNLPAAAMWGLRGCVPLLSWLGAKLGSPKRKSYTPPKRRTRG
ncbi:MAG: TIGR04086 family membrane protein [Ruminococcaceae bacterium]|nr:TIGR04086 family membrane protein [Oscillospiraceae bacterium]